MNELVQQISQRTGIPADKARQAADVVLSYLKSKLPAPVAGEIDGVMSGHGGGLADAAKGLGGMFGAKG